MTPTSVMPHMLPSGTPYLSANALATAAGTSSPPVVIRLSWGSFGGSATEASSPMWNGTPSTVAGVVPDATASRMLSPVSRRGGTSSTPGVQAVEQAADQAEHVHHRRQQDDPLAAQRHAVDQRVPVDLGDQVGGGAADHLRRSGRPGAELQHRVRRPGGLTRAGDDRLGDVGEDAQRAADRSVHRDDQLDAEPLHRLVDLVLGEPVVEQDRLGADPPHREEIGDVGQRRAAAAARRNRPVAARPRPAPRAALRPIGAVRIGQSDQPASATRRFRPDRPEGRRRPIPDQPRKWSPPSSPRAP